MKSVPFIFAIPFVSRHRAGDWERTCKRLEQTVASALQVKGDKIIVAIAYHDKPDAAFWDDSRVIGVQVKHDDTTDTLSTNEDKEVKRRAIGVWLRHNVGPCVVMGLDADDLVHKDLAERIRATDQEIGFRVNKGIKVLQGLNVDVAEMIETDFDQICGSCFVGFFNRSDLPKHIDDDKVFLTRVFRGKHPTYAERYTNRTGREVVDLDFPGVVYLLDPAVSTYLRWHQSRLGILASNARVFAGLVTLRYLLRKRTGISKDECRALVKESYLATGQELV